MPARVALLLLQLLPMQSSAQGSPPPPPSLCITSDEAEPGNSWCGKTHNQGAYTSADEATLLGDRGLLSMVAWKRECEPWPSQ